MKPRNLFWRICDALGISTGGEEDRSTSQRSQVGTQPHAAAADETTQEHRGTPSSRRAPIQEVLSNRIRVVGILTLASVAVVLIGLCGILIANIGALGANAVPDLSESSATATGLLNPTAAATSDPGEGFPQALLSVEVQNGTGDPGLEIKTAAYLQGNGFRVRSGGNADRLDYQTSRIEVLTGQIVTAHSIASLLNLPSSAVEESSRESGDTDILVVLGRDYRLPVPASEPEGKIVFTCQIYKNRDRNQICLMNADGSGQRRLTQADDADHFYPSVAPDGRSVVFSSNLDGDYEIYELDLSGGRRRLTSMGESYAPEISPDGSRVVFAHTGTTHPGIWVINRDGTDVRAVTEHENWGAWDPVWSPDGQWVLFASDQLGAVELFSVRADGSGLRQMTRTHAIFGDERRIRGRNDWSPDGSTIASYIGQNWDWDLFMVDRQGGNFMLLTTGGDSLAPSFSPDSQWITYTSYAHNPGISWACEIYIMRVDGSETRRLTFNEYCDWQPRWGP